MATDSHIGLPNGNGNLHTQSDPQRTYQVVVAATQKMGIGKDGDLPWKLPGDLRFFKDVTLATSDTGKKNAVIMGRKTWESIPLAYRPLTGRLNVVLTRSGSFDIAPTENVLSCGSMASALQLLAASPYSMSIERVYVIGGGQILREALNAPRCDAIHLTDIKTSIECDTFIPAIDLSVFQPWYASFPKVENNIEYSFITYGRVRRSAVKAPNGELSCRMYQRSADMGLGVPFNIASYSLLTCIIAHVCDLVPGDFIHTIGDAHVYRTHIRPLQEQLQKQPKPLPILKINPNKKDIDSFEAADFNLLGYDPHQKIEMKMAV